MLNTIKQTVNSSSLRTRLGMEPDMIRVMIMDGERIVEVVEGFLDQEALVDSVIAERLEALVAQ